MNPVFYVVGGLVVLIAAIFLFAFAELSILTYGRTLPLLVIANALALSWAAWKGQLFPAIAILALTVFAFFARFRHEQRRSRILAHCVAALLSEAVANERLTREELLQVIDHEITQDFWIEPLDRFSRRDRTLFDEPHLSNGGFVSWYYRIHDAVASEWLRIKAVAKQRESTAI